MKKLIKLNAFALLYGFVFFIQTELMVNVYRLERIMHWFNNTSGLMIVLTIFIISTVIFFLITYRYFNNGKYRYFLTILWIPYYAALVYLASVLLPAANHADEPPPVLGLIIIGAFLAFPFYVLIINALCTKSQN